MPDPIAGHDEGQDTCEFCGEDGRAEAESQVWALLAILRDHGCSMSDTIDVLIHGFVRVYGSAVMLGGLLAVMEEMAPTLRTVVEPLLREALDQGHRVAVLPVPAAADGPDESKPH